MPKRIKKEILFLIVNTTSITIIKSLLYKLIKIGLLISNKVYKSMPF